VVLSAASQVHFQTFGNTSRLWLFPPFPHFSEEISNGHLKIDRFCLKRIEISPDFRTFHNLKVKFTPDLLTFCGDFS